MIEINKSFFRIVYRIMLMLLTGIVNVLESQGYEGCK